MTKKSTSRLQRDQRKNATTEDIEIARLRQRRLQAGHGVSKAVAGAKQLFVEEMAAQLRRGSYGSPEAAQSSFSLQPYQKDGLASVQQHVTSVEVRDQILADIEQARSVSVEETVKAAVQGGHLIGHQSVIVVPEPPARPLAELSAVRREAPMLIIDSMQPSMLPLDEKVITQHLKEAEQK